MLCILQSHSLISVFERLQSNSSFVLMESTNYADRVDYVQLDATTENVHFAAADSLHEVVFAVKQKFIARLQAALVDISNPNSKNYGAFWSRDQVAALTSNTYATELILAFLNMIGAEVVSVSLHGEYVVAQAPVSLWEQCLSTTFHVFQNTIDTSIFVRRANSYSIPASLSGYISCIFNVVFLPPLITTTATFEFVSEDKTTTSSSSSSLYPGFIYPQLINQIYQVPSNIGARNVSQAVYATSGQSYSPSDLAQFQSIFNLPTETVAKTVGGHSTDSCASNIQICAEVRV
jgi:hypothetical protein